MPMVRNMFRILSDKGSKVILIALFSLVNIPFVSAQYDYDNARPVGGLLAGANFTQVDGDGYKGYNKISPAGGGILYLPVRNAGLPFEGTLAWSMEVLYAGKGAYGSGSGIATNVQSQKISLVYAEIPLQLNYWRGPRKSIYGAGFALGYLGASAEEISMVSGQVYNFPFRKLDVSFLATASLHIGYGFFVSPRFQYSLASIRKPDAALSSFGRAEQFNNVWSIKLMYLFNVR